MLSLERFLHNLQKRGTAEFIQLPSSNEMLEVHFLTYKAPLKS